MEEPSNISRRRKSALAAGGIDYQAKRKELVQLAARLFKKKGYKATTLNDIAKEAGLERATLYYYIGNKDELFREAIQGVLKDNLNETSKIVRLTTIGIREKLELLFEKLMVSYEQNYPQMYVYIQELMHEVQNDPSDWAKQMLQQTRQFEKMVHSLIEQGIAEGLFRNDVTPGVATNGFFGMFNWTHRWFNPAGMLPARDIAQMLCRVYLDGLAANNQPESLPPALTSIKVSKKTTKTSKVTKTASDQGSEVE